MSRAGRYILASFTGVARTRTEGAEPMGLFLPGRKVKPRSFSYEPRFYDPKKDESLKRRMQVHRRSRRRRSPLGLLYFLGLLVFSLYIYFNLG